MGSANLTSIPRADVDAFNSRGYVLVKRVFSKVEIQAIHRACEQLRENASRASAVLPDPVAPKAMSVCGDLLGKEELADLDYVILDERVLALMRQMLGPKLLYWGDSSIQFGEGQRGFHKDNVDRSNPDGPDWKSYYSVIRIGIYLQDHSKHSGGLKVRVNSHNYASRHRGRAVNVPSEEGDVVAWFLRTSHSGNAVRMKFFPNLCLHPRIERVVPLALRVPEQRERMAIFCSFAAPGEHAERYIQYQVKRGDYHEHWRRSGYHANVLNLAARREIQILPPIPEYGTLHPLAS